MEENSMKPRTLLFAAVLFVVIATGCASALPAQTSQPTDAIPLPAATSTSESTAVPVVPSEVVTVSASGSGQGSTGPALTSIPADQPTLEPTAAQGEPSGEFLNVTLDDNGKTLNLTVGQRFLLYLQNDPMIWTVNLDDQGVVIRPILGVMVIKGAQGIFEAAAPGQATLSAIGDMPCRQATLPCMTPSLAFQVTIIVK
jgi:hypothetical protein